MQDPIGSLELEHAVIGGVVEALTRYADRLARDGGAPRDDLDRFVTFFREFADFRHHDAEESILLPALARAGLAWDSEPIAAIRRDHDQERYLVRVLRHAALQSSAWSDEARRHVAAVATELASFLRAHIAREERLVYPAARARLGREALATLARDLGRFERSTAPGVRAELLRTAAELTARYQDQDQG
jgi:hemerythrin-like domain-containing protein